MADPVVFRNGFFALSTGAANAHFGDVKEVELPIAYEEIDDAVMGDLAKVKFPGVQTGDAVRVRLRQDFTGGGTDSKLWAFFNGKKKVNFKARPVNSGVTTANPSYLGQGYVMSYPPIRGSHGQGLETEILIKLASGSSITRSTST
jgi:hypothetical protein